MEIVSFKPVSQFQYLANKVFVEQKSKVLENLPFAEVEHIGSSSIPNSLTKGDLDINIRVQKEDFSASVGALKEMYEINQSENWTDSFASFKDSSLEIDFGAQLTVIGSLDDKFVAQRDLLLNHPELVEELNHLKRSFEGKSMDDYRKAKYDFFRSYRSMPILYIMCGVGFSGKSFLAKKIAEKTDSVLISQDAMYFENKDRLNIDEDSDEQWRMLLDMCIEKIKKNLLNGKSVVFDNVNTRLEHREELREIATSANADTKVVFLDTPLEVQKQRQSNNLTAKQRHDVKQEYLDQAIEELEVPTEEENTLVFKPETNLEVFLNRL